MSALVRYHACMQRIRGFSMLEVVISLFVVTVAILLSTAILYATSLTRHAKYEDLATKIASNELETLRGLGYAALPASNTFSDTLLASLPQSSASYTVQTYNATTKQVNVVVSWKEQGATVSVTLATLVTQTGGLP
jgi:Tfp pilus assembly protein PilV